MCKLAGVKTLDIAIRKFNGPAGLARRLGVTPQVVTNWRSRGVSVNRCKDVERVTRDSRVTRATLRPKIFGR